jgi:hypothetical protein
MVGLSLEILFGNGEMTWNEFEVSLDRLRTGIDRILMGLGYVLKPCLKDV